MQSTCSWGTQCYTPPLLAQRRRPGAACRNGLPHVVSVNKRLIEALKRLGPEAVVDMDLAAQRESLVRL
jgi:hypothetical protein